MTTQDTKVTIICRDNKGKEIARQDCRDLAEAERLMVARNRPFGLSTGYPAWAIETVITDPA